MTIKKLIISIIFMCFLNGCTQNIAFLGPIMTGASTGSAPQAGLSYVSGKAVKKITGKTSVENIKILLSKNEGEKEVDENADIFFKQIKQDINKSSSIKNLIIE